MKREILACLAVVLLLGSQLAIFQFVTIVEAQTEKPLKIYDIGGGHYRFKTLSNDIATFSEDLIANLSRWNEAYFTIGMNKTFLLQKFPGGTFKTVFHERDNKVAVSLKVSGTTVFEIRWYPLNSTEGRSEYGGVEYELLVYDPSVFSLLGNTISLPINSTGLKFYYQPPLYKEYGFTGSYQNATFFINATHVAKLIHGNWTTIAYRPPDVVGSYAVYHESKINGKYKTGKAFHIYRPKAFDSNGNTVWCNLKIDEAKGLLKIVIPQDFLDKAVYPVVIDPTFGYTSAGASAYSFSENVMVGSLFTAPSDVDEVESLTFYVRMGTPNANPYLKGVIVRHSSLEIVYNGKGQPVDNLGLSGAWHTSEFSSSPSVYPNVEYVLMVIASDDTVIYYDSGGANQGHVDTSNSYSSPKDPTDATHNNNKYSIYCTYAPPNQPPTNDACDSTPAFDVNVYGWVNVTVSDPDGVADLDNVQIKVTTSDSKYFTLKWTQSTDSFSEVSDPDNICTLDASGSTCVNIDSDTDKICFRFKIGVAAQKGYCSVQVTTTDDCGEQDIDTYANEFTLNFYMEITVNDSTHGWTGLTPGDIDVLLTNPSDGDIDITVSSNAPFNIQVKGSGDLSDGNGHIIPLSNIKVHASDLASATSLTTTYQNIPGLTSQARGVGLSKSFKLWITVPNNLPPGNYTYTLYIQGVEAS